MFKFRLVDENGADQGTFETSEPNWGVGHRIHRGAGDSLEVVRSQDANDGDDVSGVLIVRRR